MERENFDTELFIDEIEKRPVIWDMESDTYSNKILKRRAWEELVLIFSNSDDSEEKKKDIGNSLQKKWKGLRDTFVREMKKKKNAPSGSGASKYTYVYFQRLMFLERSVRNKTTESNITDTSESYETCSNELGHAVEEDLMRPPSQNIKRKKMSAADAEFLNIIKNNVGCRNQQQPPVSCATEGDDDKLFCLSLHKELVKVPEANRIAAKIEIMKILQKAQHNNSYSFENYSTASKSSASSSVSYPARPRYHTQISRPNEFVFEEYDPTTPSLPVQVRYSTLTPATAYSPSPSSRDSQDSECLELFQNNEVTIYFSNK